MRGINRILVTSRFTLKNSPLLNGQKKDFTSRFMTEKYIPANEIRQAISNAASRQYGDEVPLYNDMVGIARESNQAYINAHPEKFAGNSNALNEISQTRHAAIRIVTGYELSMMNRIFAVMGMDPVEYYNLLEVQAHSTAFSSPLAGGNPFRVFTSKLRLELLGEEVQKMAKKAIEKRNFFTPKLIELVEIFEVEGGLTREQSNEFEAEVVALFAERKEALISRDDYEALLKISPLAADTLAFYPHFNHFTPEVEDVFDAHKRMNEAGMRTINAVQGPPQDLPLFLNQTSFVAVEKTFKFPNPDGTFTEGTHTSSFGELEQNKAAGTKKAFGLYQEVLAIALSTTKETDPDYRENIQKTFEKHFSNDPKVLRKEGLIFCQYKKTSKEGSPQSNDLESLIEEGYVSASPFKYWGFLPRSAVGIFESNGVVKNSDKKSNISEEEARNQFEQALGRKVLSIFDIYAAEQARSIQNTYKKLDLGVPEKLAEEVNTAIVNDPYTLNNKEKGTQIGR